MQAEDAYKKGLAFNQQGRRAEAVGAFATAADQGHGPACYAMGLVHALGQGVAPDMARAKAYLEDGAGRGHVPSALALASLLVQAGDLRASARMLGELAARDEPVAWRELGLMALVHSPAEEMGLQALMQAGRADGMARLLIEPLQASRSLGAPRNQIHSILAPLAAAGTPPPEGPPDIDALTGLILADMSARLAPALNTSPRVAIGEARLSPLVGNAIILAALPELRPSAIVDPETGRERRDPYRTGAAMSFSPVSLTPSMALVRQLMCQLAGVPVSHCEPFSVIAYREGEQYRPHYDGFTTAQLAAARDPATGGLPPQRQTTSLLYLNDRFQGGGTGFPKLGLRVEAEAGKLLVFDNVGPEGDLAPDSLHEGESVQGGVKLIASQWMRAAPFEIRPASEG